MYLIEKKLVYTLYIWKYFVKFFKIWGSKKISLDQNFKILKNIFKNISLISTFCTTKKFKFKKIEQKKPNLFDFKLYLF